MKKILFSGLLAVILIFAFTALAAERPQVPADGLKLAYLKKTVVFNHSTHEKGIQCGDCHHPVDGKEDYRLCATSGCHDNLDPKDKSVNSLYQSFHKAKGTKFPTCVSCHVQVAGNDKDMKRDLAGCLKSKCHPS